MDPALRQQLLMLLVVIVLLLVAATVAMIFVLQAYDREQKFKNRLDAAITPTVHHPSPFDEELSLTKQVSRLDELKDRAARFIGVDLRQAETYPVKWWLVPPLTLLVDIALIWIAKHPLHNHPPLVLVLVYIGTPVLWVVLTKFTFGWFTNRRNTKLLEQFPDALSTVVRCVRVGIPMGEALRTVARDAPEPTKAEFSILADKVTIGIPLDVALRELALRISLTEYQFFATAVTLQSRSGGGITQTLETLADVIRKRVGLKARGYALTAEARMSSLVLSVLPFLAGGTIFLMQRQYMMTLFTTASGNAVLGLAFIMLVIGMGINQYMLSNVLK